MKRPWSRAYPKSRRTTLGLSLGSRPNSTEASIGWVLIAPGKNATVRTDDRGQETGDPGALALDRARKAMSEGAEGVDLFLYADDRAFADTRAQLEGMSREAHIVEVRRIAAMLKADMIPVRILWIDGRDQSWEDGSE